MFCKKFFSRSLLSLFAFNSLNVVAPVCAMESCEKNNKPSFESWCGDYSFDKTINKSYEKFKELLHKHQMLINSLLDEEINKNISEVYIKILNSIYDVLNNNNVAFNSFVNNLKKFGFNGVNTSYRNESDMFQFICIYPCVKRNDKDNGRKQGYLNLYINFTSNKLYCVGLVFVPQDY